MFKKLIVPALVGLALAPAIASSATLKELEDRINQLEEEALIATEGVYELSTNDENRMKISGYVDTEYHMHTNSKVDRFRLHHMSLFFEKNLGNKWRFFSEIEYEDGPKLEGDGTVMTDTQGKIFLESVHMTYAWQQEANIRFGRMFTPAGIWNVDHYPAFVPTQERPQHIRKMFPQVVDGLQAFGTVSPGKATFVNYDLYTGNGKGNTGKGDKNQDKALGARLSVVFPMLDHFELGTSYYSDGKDSSKNDEEFAARGLHAKVKAGPVTLQYEQATGAWDADERVGHYTQLTYDWDKFTFGVRNDYYDKDAADTIDTDSGIPGIQALDKSGITYNSLFVNYHVNKAVTLKAEYHAIDYEDNATKDFGKTIFSVVGYLGN
ncbi:MAG: hypothetical protein V3R49_04445 [Gammaproteobacteria bacterium]